MEKSQQHMQLQQVHQQQQTQHHINNNHTTQLHQQNSAQTQQQQQCPQQKFSPNSEHGVPSHNRPHLMNGTILKTALTNPSEVRKLWPPFGGFLTCPIKIKLLFSFSI